MEEAKVSCVAARWLLEAPEYGSWLPEPTTWLERWNIWSHPPDLHGEEGAGDWAQLLAANDSINCAYVIVQFSSVAQSCLTLCNPMDCSMTGLPVHHQLPEPTQTHVHWVGDAIQPSHPLSSPSSPAFNLSQHQGLCNQVFIKTQKDGV